MSEQSDALLALATGYVDIPVDARLTFEGALWSNPIICTPLVHDMAEADADDEERAILAMLVERGLVVVADDPTAKRAELAGSRPGYMNRAARRAYKVKGGKRK